MDTIQTEEKPAASSPVISAELGRQCGFCYPSSGARHLTIFLDKDKGNMITLPNFLEAHSNEVRASLSEPSMVRSMTVTHYPVPSSTSQ